MNAKTTKRALFSSVLAIVLCLAMLIGTTFAWFTDTASTGVNKIQAGNLKMKVSYKNDVTTAFTEVNEETPVFKDGALWEPGHVEFVVLKVENVGTLALKYKLGINIASETESISVTDKTLKLSDYINFAVIDGDATTAATFNRETLLTDAGAGQAINKGYNPDAISLGVDEEKTVTLVVWMPTTVGNDANYDASKAEAPVINLGINVVATQDTVENDSFGPDYDKNAVYPDADYVSIPATGTDEDKQTALNEAITSAATDKMTVIDLPASGTAYTLPGTSNTAPAREITIVGNKGTKIDLSNSVTQANASITMKGVTVQSGNFNYNGLQHSASNVFEDCTFTGTITLYAADVTFNNCTFTTKADYAVWTYGAKNVTFNNCKFETGGKAILVYNEYTNTNFVANVIVNGCDFTSTKDLATNKAAIETGSNGGNTATSNKYNITITGGSVIDFATNNSTSSWWGNKNSMDADHLSVTIDGVSQTIQ